MTETDFAHLHMDADSRNRRLYQWLAEMGLCVFPISAPDDSNRIDYLMVSADLPASIRQGVGKEPPGGGIPLPMTWPVVGNVVGPAESLGDSVVLMPTVRR